MPNYIQSCCIKVILLISNPERAAIRSNLSVESIKRENFRLFILNEDLYNLTTNNIDMFLIKELSILLIFLQFYIN